MHITERFLAFTLLGAEWVLWLLIGLSIISFAIMIERAYYFLTHGVDVDSLAADLRRLLAKGNVADARARVKGSDSVEMTVMAAGLDEVERGVDAVAEAMVGPEGARAHAPRAQPRLPRHARQQRAVHRPLRHRPRHHQGLPRSRRATRRAASAVVMAGISEALVATAVGLLVAIPAVVGFNYFNRRVRADARQRRRARARRAGAAQGRRGARRRRRRQEAEARRPSKWPAARRSYEDDEGGGGAITDINVTPLVDITLVLLIIFMVTAPMIVNNPSIKVELPKAATGDETLKSTLALTLSRDAAGGYVRSTPTARRPTRRQVKAMIPDMLSKNKDLQAIIAADRGISYGDVVHIVDLVKSLGVHKFALNTDPNP